MSERKSKTPLPRPAGGDSPRLRGEISSIAGLGVVVEGDDIDTDRIIPARFLRCITFDGLGEHAFEDDRKELAEAGETHPFDDPARTRAKVLFVGRNFGCGSSREHAPQALMRWGGGLAAIVGESFAEIFFGNCVANGIACVTADSDALVRIRAKVAADSNAEVTVDLEAMKVSAGGESIDVRMPDGTRGQLLSGRWDTTGELLRGREDIAKTTAALPYFGGWR